LALTTSVKAIHLDR